MPFQKGNKEGAKSRPDPAATQSVVPRTLADKESPLTVDALKAVMPKRQKGNITPSLVKELNTLIDEPEAREVFRENIMGYCGVLTDPNMKLVTYINAVKYMSFKLMGDTNQMAWMKTFPERYKRLIDTGKDEGFIRSTVACYNRNKVVNSIRELSIIPTWILNQDVYQKAINTQAHLMVSAKSEKVRTDAANSLLTHLKQPEASKVSLDVNVKEDDSIRELRHATTELVKAQKEALMAGVLDAKEVAESKILIGECDRVDE